MVADLESVEPAGWKRGVGYSNGLLAPAGGRVLFCAGQIGWDAGQHLVSAELGGHQYFSCSLGPLSGLFNVVKQNGKFI